MKYLTQFGIIAGVSFAGELLNILLPFPVPASVYGLILLFLLLMMKIIPLENIEGAADFFLSIMPILFISPSVSLIASMEIMKDNAVALLLMIFLSTFVVTSVTALSAQTIIRSKRRKAKKQQDLQGGKINE